MAFMVQLDVSSWSELGIMDEKRRSHKGLEISRPSLGLLIQSSSFIHLFHKVTQREMRCGVTLLGDVSWLKGAHA